MTRLDDAEIFRLLDGLMEGIQVINRDLKYVYVNKVAAQHGRKSKDELVGRTMTAAYPGIENTEMFRRIRECVDSAKPHHMENEFTFPDGSKGWFELHIEPADIGVVILSIDIAARKNEEKEKQRLAEEVASAADVAIKSAEAVRTIFASARDGILVADAGTHKFIKANGAICRMLGYSREEVLALALDDIHPREDLPYVLEQFGKQLKGEIALATKIPVKRKDGSVFYADVNSAPANLDGKQCVVGVFRDITDRKNAEECILHLNAMLRGIRNVNQLITRERDRKKLIQEACDLLVESRGCLAVFIGLTAKPGDSNVELAGSGKKMAAISEMLKRGAIPDCVSQAMKGRDVVVRKKPDESCPGCPVASGSYGDRDTIVLGLTQEDKTYGFMMACLNPGFGDNADEMGLLKEVANDIAFALHSIELEEHSKKVNEELQHTEEQLLHSQKMEAIGRLAGGVAHDFNNLMTVVIGTSDLLLNRTSESDDEGRRLVQEIRKAGDRAAGLTRQLLAFSRKQVIQPKVLNLNEVIGSMGKMLQRLIGEDISMAVSPAADLGKVLADPGQIEQIIMNLAVNARDAMPGGGKLTLETKNVIMDGVYTATHLEAKPGSYVMLAVTDSGIGMSKETKAHLFEPFFTTKERGKGTGLGLATVFGIVKQHGGNLGVYSELGMGTTFKIYFPRVEKEAEPPTRSRAVLHPVPGEKTILVVEDEDAVRNLICTILTGAGYKVLYAQNGDEALRKKAAHGGVIHLVLTDVVLPGMSGKELADRLWAEKTPPHVLFMSGYTDDSIVHHGVLDAGVAFLPKPFTPDELVRKVREVLEGKTAQG